MLFSYRSTGLLLLWLTVLLLWAEQADGDDRSWIGAYDAAWVRLKASGTFPSVLNAAYPGLPSLRFLGDCPATPDALPFPARSPNTILDDILSSGSVRLAFQLNDSSVEDDSPVQVGEFYKAMWQLAKAVVDQVSQAYNVPLNMTTLLYSDSAQSVQAVIDGDADMTDMFLRQWTLVPGSTPELLRRYYLQPTCTMYLTTLSTSWITDSPSGPRTGSNWTSLEDLQNAGAEVVIPVYSTMQAFQSDIRIFLPNATYLDRPEQNFEENRADIVTVLEEFLNGSSTTVLMAGNADLQFAASNNNINLTGYTLGEALTPIDLPVGGYVRVSLSPTAPSSSPVAGPNNDAPSASASGPLGRFGLPICFHCFVLVIVISGYVF